MKNNEKLSFYFPGFTRKAITFSIDDGDIPNDTKFLEIVRPAGILGTFNISSPTRTTPEHYRELYRGYEIANHCAHHPLLMMQDQKYVVADEIYNNETAREYTEDDPVIYKTNVAGVYRIVNKGVGRNITDRENYIRFAKENRKDLEKIFGEGTIKGFVWPFGERQDKELCRALYSAGYSYIRGGKKPALEEQDFNITEDKMHWNYTVRETNILYGMELYENYPDDGNLKVLIIGVHARDYERNGKWDDLRRFAEVYGNRPNDYYYATNIDVIEYEAAVESLIIDENTVENPSDKDIYMTVLGERTVLKAKSKINY